MTTAGPADTRAWGQRLARNLAPGDVVLLSGPLGSGKTEFVRGVAEGLGVRATVTSPTFTLLHRYDGRLPLFHADLYRLEDPAELWELGLEAVAEAGGVLLVEWGERGRHLFPEALEVHLEPEEPGENQRRLSAVARGERPRALLAAWRRSRGRAGYGNRGHRPRRP